MNRFSIFLFGSVLAFSSCWFSTAYAQMRDFTSTDGRKLTAKITGYGSGVIRVETADGRNLSIPLTSLSQEDREWADLWSSDPHRKAGDGGSTEPAPAGPASKQENYLLGSGYDYVLYNDEKFIMLVNIIIDGKPYKFMVNTGLPYSYIDDPLADAFGMQTKPINTVLAGGVPVSEGVLKDFTLGETTIPARLFRVTRLDRTGLKNADESISGVLGYDFLQEFKVVIEYHFGGPNEVRPELKKLYFKPPGS
ncbi:MAG: retropepsin-like aspartic protease [Verrucomicrobiota bacterium]